MAGNSAKEVSNSYSQSRTKTCLHSDSYTIIRFFFFSSSSDFISSTTLCSLLLSLNDEHLALVNSNQLNSCRKCDNKFITWKNCSPLTSIRRTTPDQDNLKIHDRASLEFVGPPSSLTELNRLTVWIFYGFPSVLSPKQCLANDSFKLNELREFCITASLCVM